MNITNLDAKMLSAVRAQRRYSVKVGNSQAHLLTLLDVFNLCLGEVPTSADIRRLCELEVGQRVEVQRVNKLSILVARTE